MSELASRGWHVFGPEASVLAWATEAHKDALRAVRDPKLAHWHQCEGTWFVGLDALNNDAQGRVGTSGPLAGQAVEALQHWTNAPLPTLHKAQISVVYPGYPQPRENEGCAGFRYRQKRDAAHVDGVLGLGHPKRRFVREPHAFILGLPLTQASVDAAPLVVWEGSHRIMQRAFAKAFDAHPGIPAEDIDVTDIYIQARKHVFESCRRVRVHARPGQSIVVHRLALHGVAPWGQNATSDPDGRMIAYFRPAMTGGARAWARDVTGQ